LQGRGKVDDSTHTITIEGAVQSDTLLVFQGVAALGNADFTNVRLLNCTFSGLVNNRDLILTLTDGRLTITDIWRYGGPRLVGGVRPEPVLVIQPNPAITTATIRLFRVQLGCTVTITDITGRECAVIRPVVNPQSGEASIDITPGLVRGIYFVRVVSGTQSAVKALFAE
jgi:hypothetical protein